MFRSKFPKLIVFAFAVVAGLSMTAFSQNDPPVEPPQNARFAKPAGQPGPRPNLLQELGLTREQIQAVRRINQERKPVEQAARKRFQDANRSLNMAIYSDNVDEADFQAKLSEFQSAQAEMARIKFANELAVRRVLTPDQLVKFRDLRQRFADIRENRQNRPVDPPARRALQRFRRGNQPPVN